MEPKRTPRSKLWWGGLIGVCVVVAAMIATLCALQLGGPKAPETVEISVPAAPPPAVAAEPEPEGPAVGHRVGETAPPFSLELLDGTPMSLADHRGRVVILDFWASWCVPCRLSMPTLEETARELGDDVILLGVSLDRTEAEARAYVEARGYTELVTVYSSLREARAVAGDYAVLGIPKTFVIDRGGVVRFAGHPNLLTRSLIESLL